MEGAYPQELNMEATDVNAALKALLFRGSWYAPFKLDIFRVFSLMHFGSLPQYGRGGRQASR